MSPDKPRRAAFALLVLITVWAAVLGTSLIWIVVGVCKYYGMELKGGDWIQAAASLTGVGAAVFIANSQMRRDVKQSAASTEVALTALVKIAELSQHYVKGLYDAVSPNFRSQWHVEQVQSLHRTLMALDLLSLPGKKMVEYVIQLRGLLEYALHKAEETVNLIDRASALAAREEISAAALMIQGVVINLNRLAK
ncbi:hypothetical protein [Pseudomonas petrae]|uniref:Uncharacterized protein n=1 Tax=Pseudomonas petrae TaxID=2912190 RepID=A0ABS9ID44_9PSED|nr:hypothetical protein [Pseudomonas petrae]MCF7545309.1 hypothetical protein [Pseudomonas petrae]